MSTLVSYLLAAILQFLSVNVPPQAKDISHMASHQCQETKGVIQYAFIINNEQETITSKKEL